MNGRDMERYSRILREKEEHQEHEDSVLFRHAIRTAVAAAAAQALFSRRGQ